MVHSVSQVQRTGDGAARPAEVRRHMVGGKAARQDTVVPARRSQKKEEPAGSWANLRTLHTPQCQGCPTLHRFGPRYLLTNTAKIGVGRCSWPVCLISQNQRGRAPKRAKQLALVPSHGRWPCQHGSLAHVTHPPGSPGRKPRGCPRGQHCRQLVESHGGYGAFRWCPSLCPLLPANPGSLSSPRKTSKEIKWKEAGWRPGPPGSARW